MKKIILIALLFVGLNFSAEAQNPAYPYGLSFKALFMDYQSQNGGSISNFKAYHHGFEIGLTKRLQDNINLVVPVKAGIVSESSDEFNFTHRKVFGLDAQVQYLFYQPDARLTPYVMAGVGGVNEIDDGFHLQVPVGLGVYFKVQDNAYITWQSEFRYALEDDRNNLQHGLGFVYLFGNPSATKEEEEKDDLELMDSDGDGLEDDIDLCPQVAGKKELKGCPDLDEDGIPDYRDDCPGTFGLAVFKGCPDTDGDGISDSNDECPNLAGTQANNGCPENDKDQDGISDEEDHCPDIKGTPENNGCPKVLEDKDGDGVADSEDNCPNIAGSRAASGCPDADGDGISDFDDKCPNKPGIRSMNGCPDSDGDGIDDSRDRCPNARGSVASGGCPEIAQEDLSVLELAMRAVSFDTGKATLRPESYPILNQIANILEKYPSYNLLIEGHTDNVGSAVNNQLLSERRAKACFEYLVRKGVNADNMSYVGYGEARPINSNDSLRGRSLNRRVEFSLKPR